MRAAHLCHLEGTLVRTVREYLDTVCMPGIVAAGAQFYAPGTSCVLEGPSLQNSYAEAILANVLASICRIFNDHDVPGYDGAIHRVVLEEGLDNIVPLFRGNIFIEGKRRRCSESERVCIGLRY